jgi:hypothetical protein
VCESGAGSRFSHWPRHVLLFQLRSVWPGRVKNRPALRRRLELVRLDAAQRFASPPAATATTVTITTPGSGFGGRMFQDY